MLDSELSRLGLEDIHPLNYLIETGRTATNEELTEIEPLYGVKRILSREERSNFSEFAYSDPNMVAKSVNEIAELESLAATGEVLLREEIIAKKQNKKPHKKVEKTESGSELIKLQELVMNLNKKMNKQNIKMKMRDLQFRHLLKKHEVLNKKHEVLNKKHEVLNFQYSREIPPLKSIYSQLVLGNTFIALLTKNDFVSAFNTAFPAQEKDSVGNVMKALYAERNSNNNNGVIETHIATWLSNNPVFYDVSVDELILLDKLRENRNSAAHYHTMTGNREKIVYAMDSLPEGRLKDLVTKIVYRVV